MYPIIFLVGLLLTGCVSPTPYQEMTWTGGVSAQQLSADTWRIVARGNGATDAWTIKDYALVKAAETTIAAGATHFLILNAADASSVTRGSLPGTIETRVRGDRVTATYEPGTTYAIPKPGQDLAIRVIRGALAPAGSHSAQEIMQFVGPRVRRG